MEQVVAGIVRAVHTGELTVERLVDAVERATTLAHTTTATPATPPAPVTATATATGTADDIGLVAARRAVRVHGVLPAAGRKPLVVELDAPPTAAVGEVPWGLLPYLAGAAADVDVLRLRPLDGADDAAGAVEEVVRRSGGRPIVLVSRDAHRHVPVRDLIERITAAHPQVVMVEMGWPAWRPVGALGYLATYGAGPANARAATELLLDADGDRE
jgi:beta-N-acetylhexosaminidase